MKHCSYRYATIKTTIGLAVVLGCALAAPAHADQPDSWITMKSKLALLTTDGVSARAVNVDTVDRRVTLHGMVGSTTEKDKAEAIVRSIDGVKSVRNLLAVVLPQNAKSVKRTDAEITKQLTAALSADEQLKASDIKVESVNKGVVLLGGTAKTLTDHLSAVELASTITGVRQVSSQIQSPDVIADQEIWRERPAKKSDGDYGASDASRDIWITSMAKMRLLADPLTPALDINVDTRDGVVTLFGMVPSMQSKRAAEADIRRVGGVKRVKNELQVVSSGQQPTIEAHDEDIQRNVEKGFQDRTSLKDVDVEVRNCVARLTGSVPSGTQRLEAAVLARSTAGVCSVQDDLRIAN